MENEENWRDIQGFEDCYQVSSAGKVRSKERMILNGRGERKLNSMLMKLGKNKDGYNRVCLSKPEERKTVTVHRLVASAFLPNPDKKLTINHINGIKTDNRVDNLEWVNVRENTCHGIISKKSDTLIGISNVKNWDKIRSRISINGKSIHLGYFNTKEDANNAYKAALITYNIKNRYT